MAGNPSYDALLTTTISKYRKTFVDNISQSFYLMWFLTAKERKVEEDGGNDIVVPLMYGKNSTVKSYAGYDPLDVTPQEGLTAAVYPWRQVAGSISISRIEERKNSGEARQINLLKSKVTQTELTFQDTMDQMFFGDGTGNNSKDLFGLNLLVEDGAAWGTLGGIDSNTNTWWRNKWIAAVGAFGTTATGAGPTAMRNGYNQASRGNEHPDFGVTTQLVHELYEASLVPNQRFTSDDKIGNGGFELLKFKGAMLGFDEYCPTGVLFWLTSAYMQWTVDTQTDLITTPFVRPNDQDASTCQMLLYGNLLLSNRARQCRIAGITA